MGWGLASPRSSPVTCPGVTAWLQQGEAGVVSSPYLWCPQVPIKWMALESILHRIYTHQSDVWSYGESGRNPEAVGDLVPG